MNCKIPFTKDILFEKKVSEITSISLEHEITTEEGLLKGNFIVSGDFKSHEVSVNKEPFSYVLPFEIELMDEVDPSTIEFMIDDFTYEIVDQTVLRVNIDFNVIADKKEVEEVVEEPIFRDASELFLEEEPEILETLKPEEVIEVENRDEQIEEIEQTQKLEEPEERDEKVETKEDTQIVEDTIINSVGAQVDEYTTYHIHMVNDGETVETICTMYNSNLSILADYNDLSEISHGDKLIIPEKNE